MKPIPKLCLLFMPFYAVLSVHPLLAQSYDEVVVEAGRLFQTGKYEESFTKAQQAVIADTNRFEGYFQAGLALYKTDSLDLARQYFSQAFERAPAPQKPRIQEALTFCSNKMQFNTHVRDAEVAEQNGMVAKAAREYTEAWRLLPIHEDVGFKAVAAQIQCEGWIPAAGILATIADSSAEENVKAKAKVDLSKFLPQADAAYRQQVSKTEALLAATNVEEALSVCQKLEEQWPQRNEAYFQQARALAAQGNAEGARNALMLTIKRARYKLDEIVNDPWLFRVTTNASFVSLLNDTFGEEAINSKLAERRAQQAGEARLRELTDKCAGEWVIAEKSFTRFEFWNIYTVIFNRDGTVGIRRSVYDSGKNALEMQDDDGVTVLDGSSWKPSIATNGIFWKYNQTDVGELSSYVWKCDYTFSAPGELTYRLGGDGVIKLKRRTPDLDRSLQLERMRPFIGSWCFEMPYHEKPKKTLCYAVWQN